MGYFEDSYQACCQASTDINEHLPILRIYADDSESILELGHRTGQSASAFMVSDAPIFHSVDIRECFSWRKIAYENGQLDSNAQKEFLCWQSDSLAWQAPRKSYDLIFFDTLHTGEHLLGELCRYAPIAAKWMILHDTMTYGWEGENRGKGLLWGLITFLLGSQKWMIHDHLQNNNGLTILKRVVDERP